VCAQPDPRGLPVLICLSVLAALFAGLSLGLLGVALFALGLIAGYILRALTAS
jgi:hypothetical protein